MPCTCKHTWLTLQTGNFLSPADTTNSETPILASVGFGRNGAWRQLLVSAVSPDGTLNTQWFDGTQWRANVATQLLGTNAQKIKKVVSLSKSTDMRAYLAGDDTIHEFSIKYENPYQWDYVGSLF